MTPILRAFGAATVAYGVFAIARPQSLAKVGQLGEVDPAVRLLSQTIGVRDVLSGVSIMAAPTGRPLATALGVRSLLDAGDALVFGRQLPTARGRRLVFAVAAGWSALAAAGARAAAAQR